MKDKSNNILVHMRLMIRDKDRNNLKKVQKIFSILSLTLILININTPMTYLTHALLNISDPFENYLVKFKILS